MPSNRFYIDQPLVKGSSVLLSEGEHLHLSQVMRAKPDEFIELVNGKGSLATGKVARITKRETHVDVAEVVIESSSKTLILAQALPRINRLDFIIEKGTELGVSAFWLFAGEKSERKHLTDHQMERLKSLSIAALKQSGRLWLPQIKWCDPLLQWQSIPAGAIFGDLDATISINDTSANTLFIGPEGGFSNEEIAFLKRQNVQGVRFHENILRTDTAAITGIVLLYNRMFCK